MILGKNTRKMVTMLFIATIFVPYLAVGFMPAKVRAQDAGKIVFDYSHGQYSDYIAGNETHPGQDWHLRKNLTDMGWEVVWAFGGLNDSVLSDADALMVAGIYGEQAGFAQSEIDAVADWFNAGNKFLWVGSDSDYGGASYINANMSAMLEAVGSHIYPEPTSVEDPESNCDAAYRVVANETSDDPYVADIVDGVSKVMMHGPTCLYGSTSATAGEDAVALEETDIENVYPLSYYGDAAFITDADLIAPYGHDNGDEGPLVATAVEVNAGEAGNGIILVSGASMYGDYQPMFTEEYKDVTMDGYNLILNAISWTPPATMDWLLIGGIIGVVAVVVIIIAIVLKRR